MSATTESGAWSEEAMEVARAATGGLLFGVPLLYTMEVWWIGTQARPVRMFAVLAFISAAVLVLNMTAGFRTARDVRVRDALADTVEAMAIGIVVTAGVLFMLRELTSSTPVTAALGMVLYESIPFCLGIGVARYLLAGGRNFDSDGDDGDDGGGQTTAVTTSVADLAATVLGATFIGLSIAPTAEVPMLTSGMNPAWLLVVIAMSLLTSYAIVFIAGFSGQDERRSHRGIFQHPGVETIVTYLAALVVAAALLWLFRRGVSPPNDLLARTIVLGFPAAIGGAVGRLAL